MKTKQIFAITLSMIMANSFAVTQIDLLNAQYNYQVVSKQHELYKNKYLETEDLAKQTEKNLGIAQKNFQQSQGQLKIAKQEFEQSQQKLNNAANSVNDIWNQLNHSNQGSLTKP